jgi:predicted transcriptional regulator
MPTGVILSIKPEFADAIFNGRKKFEYRRKLFKTFTPKRVFVYASAPISRVIGHFEIAEILTDSPSRLWAQTYADSGIDKDYFFKYFRGCKEANALQVADTTLYRKPLSLQKHFGFVRPPQSFCYVTA